MACAGRTVIANSTDNRTKLNLTLKHANNMNCRNAVIPWKSGLEVMDGDEWTPSKRGGRCSPFVRICNAGTRSFSVAASQP